MQEILETEKTVPTCSTCYMSAKEEDEVQKQKHWFDQVHVCLFDLFVFYPCKHIHIFEKV